MSHAGSIATVYMVEHCLVQQLRCAHL